MITGDKICDQILNRIGFSAVIFTSVHWMRLKLHIMIDLIELKDWITDSKYFAWNYKFDKFGFWLLTVDKVERFSFLTELSSKSSEKYT